MKLTQVQKCTGFGYSSKKDLQCKRCKPTSREVALMIENIMLKNDLRNACRIIAVCAKNEDAFMKSQI